MCVCLRIYGWHCVASHYVAMNLAHILPCWRPEYLCPTLVTSRRQHCRLGNYLVCELMLTLYSHVISAVTVIFVLNQTAGADFPNVVAERHIFGRCRLWPPKFKFGQDFCTMHLSPKFHRLTFIRLEVIVLTNPQTNRHCWKHLTLFATLRYDVR